MIFKERLNDSAPLIAVTMIVLVVLLASVYVGSQRAPQSGEFTGYPQLKGNEGSSEGIIPFDLRTIPPVRAANYKECGVRLS